MSLKALKIKNKLCVPRYFRAVALICVAACLLSLTYSAAWLYDETTVEVDYNVAKLDFDLASNHMYYYYADNPTYNDNDEETDRFYDVLQTLVSWQSRLKLGSTTKSAYDTTVIPLLKTVYPPAMIDRLLDIDFENYNTEAIRIYNEYSTKIEFPFKIKNIDTESVSESFGVLYYYVNDLLDLYSEEFVVQRDASPVASSTINIAVKLKGGTTYSSDVDGEYFDNNFNDMVLPFSMRVSNSGNAAMYLDWRVTPDSDVNAASKGVCLMFLPYQFRLDALTVAEYPQYFSNGALNYRLLISGLLRNWDINQNASGYGYSDTQWRTLTHAQLFPILQQFNIYSVSTYTNSGNLHIGVEGEQNNVAQMDMLSWADYETCADYYGVNNESRLWATDDQYMLIKYNFTMSFRSSFLDYDFYSARFDDSKNYNKAKDYTKYVGVSNFDVEGYAFFAQDDGSELNAKYSMRSGYISCSYTDPTATNYIGRFRFSIRYRGFSPAQMRVRVIEQWTNRQDEIVNINQLRFTKAPEWVDNRLNDLYYYSSKLYYSTDKDTLTTLGKAKLIIIPVITGLTTNPDYTYGIDNALLDAGILDLKLSIYIDAIQPNRYDEFWDITDIPSSDATINLE